MRSVNIRSGFSWNARLFAQFKQLINSLPDFLYWADEIAESRLDMNIKISKSAKIRNRHNQVPPLQ